MMTSKQFAFYLTCLFLGQMAHTNDLKLSVHQERHFISVNTGESVTLNCFYDGNDVAKFFWYKLNLGQKLKLISTLFKYDTNGTFHDEFKSDSRFTAATEEGKIYLKITNVQVSDSAIYYCGTYGYMFEFGEGTVVDVKGSGLHMPTLVQQSASETIQPGGSVTLNCTVHTGTCDEEHSVYWFRDSEESFPRIIYTHGGRNDQCERKPNTQTHTCVYNLPMKSLNVSHAGTYYCAVASCGHILFGNRTKLDFKHEGNCCVSVYFLSGAFAFTTLLSVLMALLLYLTHKRNSTKRTESHPRTSPLSSADAEHNEGDIHYAALSDPRAGRPRRKSNNSKTECVYSSVKQ
ncbi:immunoglobulin kappa light chain-like [Oreochromis aureus]|uniref:Ig-like domain-containing protein n=1 Tax=Oreochromis aureus TaxID=47969 RepID=A0A668RBC7_OREAU|nr:immunoglobulin kappa light chain-like [Oreochromis aureus]